MIAYLFLGICLIAGFALLAKWFLSADPRQLARVLRYGGIGLAAAVVLLLALTRNLGPALALLVFFLPMILGWRDLRRRARAARGPSSGQQSRLQTAMLEVELDHDSGQMSGTVVSGRFQGRSLGELSLEDVKDLLRECGQNDPQSVPIVEAFLDRHFGPEWREDHDEATSAGGDRQRAGSGAMTVEEAYALLGLAPGATNEEIKTAHHRLMKKFHPDQGGSDYIAAKLNQAKDLLLGRR